jgi:hypothetical protein
MTIGDKASGGEKTFAFLDFPINYRAYPPPHYLHDSVIRLALYIVFESRVTSASRAMNLVNAVDNVLA